MSWVTDNPNNCCSNHEQTKAAERCTLCEKLFCEECLQVAKKRKYCQACLEDGLKLDDVEMALPTARFIELGAIVSVIAPFCIVMFPFKPLICFVGFGAAFTTLKTRPISKLSLNMAILGVVLNAIIVFL